MTHSVFCAERGKQFHLRQFKIIFMQYIGIWLVFSGWIAYASLCGADGVLFFVAVAVVDSVFMAYSFHFIPFYLLSNK